MIRAAGMMVLRFNKERQKKKTPKYMHTSMQSRAKYHQPVPKEKFHN
jgi:hypothetical protein